MRRDEMRRGKGGKRLREMKQNERIQTSISHYYSQSINQIKSFISKSKTINEIFYSKKRRKSNKNKFDNSFKMINQNLLKLVD